MSYRAIAAALALEDVSIGERLVAFSLASYANRAQRAWPATRTAARRAGLSRRQYQTARARLATRGLIEIEGSPAESVTYLAFAEAGASIEYKVNPQRFEAILSSSGTRGGARALVAALAALSDAEGCVQGLSSEELRDASGLSDRTYRRARGELLAGGEIVLERAGGGRGCHNAWRITAQAPSSAAVDSGPTRRPAPAPRQMPLVAVVRDEPSSPSDSSSMPNLDPGSAPMRTAGMPGTNPGQNRTPGEQKTPAQTPAETPAPRARAVMESQNQTTRPPSPPEGGRLTATIAEPFITDTGRRRLRRVVVDPAAELTTLTPSDQEVWSAVRERVRELAGAAIYDVWLAGLTAIATSRRDGALLLAAPQDLHRWVASRHQRLFNAVSGDVGHRVRMASDRELALHQALTESTATPSLDPARVPDRQEAI